MKKKFFAAIMAATMTFSMAITSFAADVESNLIGKFNFDESLKNEVTGTDATTVGMKLGTPMETPFNYVDGVDGKAIYLNDNGNTNGLNLGIKPSGKSYTVSVWLKAEGTTFAAPIVWIGGSNQAPESWVGLWAGFNSDYNNGPAIGSNDSTGNRFGVKPNALKGLGATNNASGDATKFDWTNVTMVINEGKGKLFYNGILVNGVMSGDKEVTEESVFPDVLEKEDAMMYLGANVWDAPFTGYIDSLYVYDRALSNEDVAQLVADTKGTLGELATFEAYKEPTTLKPQVRPNVGVISEDEGSSGINPLLIGGIIAGVVVVVIVAVIVLSSSKKKVDEEE